MPEKISEKRATWHFEIEAGPAESWRWTKARPTGTIERSSRTFHSLEACATDASQHGYGQWKNDERRQVERCYDALLPVD